MKNKWVLPAVSKKAEKAYYSDLAATNGKRRKKAKEALKKSTAPPRTVNGSGKKIDRERQATADLAALLSGAKP